MLAKPSILAILTTRRCTAQCDHCGVGAGPDACGHIPIPRIHGLIDEATRVPSIQRIVFSGGECFLLGHALNVLIAHAASRGFETRAITNGYWAVNERSARARATTLRAAGLDEVMFSTGTFHQRFVDVERVVFGAQATARAGIATRISVEDCDQSTFDDAALREAFRDELAAGRVTIERDPWVTDPAGRGKTALSHDGRLRAGLGYAGGRCPAVLSVLTVTPDQRLVACCGMAMEQLAELAIGSVATRALDEVLRASPDRLVQMWLHTAGPAAIAAFVAEYDPAYRLASYASICEACSAVVGDRRAMAVVAEHAGEVAAAIATAFVRLQTPAAHPA